MCYRTGKYAVCTEAHPCHVSFSPEILQAGAVKGLKVDRWWSLQLVRTGHSRHIVHDSLLSAFSRRGVLRTGRNHKLGPLCCHGWKPIPSNKSSPFAEKPGVSQNMARLSPRHYQEFQSSLVLFLPLFRGLFTFIFFQSRPFLYVSFAGWQFSQCVGRPRNKVHSVGWAI